MNSIILFVALLVVIPAVVAADEKYAFVTIYYANGKMSRSDFVGIRTMYKSFTKINSKADFLVIAAKDTPNREVSLLRKDGMTVRSADLVNPYRQHSLAPDYQKMMNIIYLWELTEYKRVVFVDYYTLFTHNFDSIFDCSYLCLKDEQPLVYSNDMMVITPGHEPTKKIFSDSMVTRATAEQYRYFDHYGYYSTELYEISQASPLFMLGDAESNDSNIRRYMNFVNFPSIMWYEKFNWHLYSCSGLNDPEMPVYSINFRYTLGHRSYFLPTHWFSYYYIWELNSYYLNVRQELSESFAGSIFFCCALIAVLLALTRVLIQMIASLLGVLYKHVGKPVKERGLGTSFGKLLVASLIGLYWLFAREVVPGTLRPSLGYLFFYLIDSLLLAITLLGFNSATNTILGNGYLKPTTSLWILLTLQVANGMAYVIPFITSVGKVTRMGLLFVQFFVQLYCLYSQISPLLVEKKVAYSALPE